MDHAGPDGPKLLDRLKDIQDSLLTDAVQDGQEGAERPAMSQAITGEKDARKNKRKKPQCILDIHSLDKFVDSTTNEKNSQPRADPAPRAKACSLVCDQHNG